LQLLEENFRSLFELDRSAYATRVIDSPNVDTVDGEFDLAYSLIAMQHNPPPVMAHMLRVLLRSLAPGGLALVHLPTAPAIEGYAFSVDAYLEAVHPKMEMHALPRDVIFDLARDEGVAVVWARYTDWCGPSFVNELIAFAKKKT
jgi:SAM-dependent methyltransferase